MATLLYLVPSVVLLALTQVQVTSSDLIQVENSRNSGNGNCSCGLSNMTLTMIDNGLQLVDPSAVFASPSMHRHMHHLMVNVSRCLGGCGCASSPSDLSYMSNNPTKSKFVCRPTLTSLKTVMIPVHWLSSHEPVKLTMALEEHKSCLCVDPNSINVTLDVDVRLRRELHMREEEKLSREIRSVAPTISNAIITTRATSSAAAHVKSGSSSGSETSATASQAASDMTNGDLAGSVKPTEHEIVYYKTCLACREQQDLCKVNGQIYDSEVCHCVYPASRTFLNSFYTLGVVMLTVMVCCFLVFGVQKGDENVLNSSRRSTRRSNSCSRRCSSTHNQQPHTASSGSQGGGQGQHRSSVTSGGRRYSSRDDVERNECIGLNNGGRITTNNTNPDQPVTGNNTGAHTTLIHNLNSNNNSNPTAAPSASSNATATPSTAGGAHNGSSTQCGPDAIMVKNVASAATTETS